MAGLRVFGAVGKTTTRTMVQAILQSADRDRLDAALVLLSPDRAGQEAIAALDEGTRVVASADSIAPAEVPASAVTFGLGDRAMVRATGLDATLDGTTFTLRAEDQERQVSLRLLGEHLVAPALAAIAVARMHDVPLDDAIAALEALETLGAGRMERLDTASGMVVINDAASAAPESVASALKTLAQVAGSRRTVAVLGQLDDEHASEEEERAAHDRVGRLIVRLNVKKLIVVGHDARHIHNAAGLEGSWDGESVLVESAGQAYDLLRDELRSQDVVLVKASEAAALGTLAVRLMDVAK